MARKRRVPRYVKEEKQRQYRPPKRRLDADLSQQAPNNTYDPRWYYKDVEFVCRDCGCREVWTAEQQKWWYEVAKGPIQSVAIRCVACRKARRDAHGGTPRRSQTEKMKAENQTHEE